MPRSAEVYPVFPDLFFPVAPVPIAPTVSFEKLWGLFFLPNFWIAQVSQGELNVVSTPVNLTGVHLVKIASVFPFEEARRQFFFWSPLESLPEADLSKRAQKGWLVGLSGGDAEAIIACATEVDRAAGPG